LTCIKGSKPTFNSQYDNGIYMYPLQGGKNRFHPTQKSLQLFEELIRKHSNENDTVLDTFLGGGTTLFACKNTNRKFKGCELDKEYFDKIIERLLTMNNEKLENLAEDFDKLEIKDIDKLTKKQRAIDNLFINIFNLIFIKYVRH
jgi:DNA modification methylase